MAAHGGGKQINTNNRSSAVPFNTVSMIALSIGPVGTRFTTRLAPNFFSSEGRISGMTTQSGRSASGREWMRCNRKDGLSEDSEGTGNFESNWRNGAIPVPVEILCVSMAYFRREVEEDGP